MSVFARPLRRRRSVPLGGPAGERLVVDHDEVIAEVQQQVDLADQDAPVGERRLPGGIAGGPFGAEQHALFPADAHLGRAGRAGGRRP